MDICRICFLIMAFIELVAQKLTQNTKEQNSFWNGEGGYFLSNLYHRKAQKGTTSKLPAYRTFKLCFCVVLVWTTCQKGGMEGKGLKVDRLEY